MRPETLQTLRAIAIEPSYFNLRREKLDVADIVSLVVDLGANCVRLGALTHTGRAYYPSKIVPRAPGLGGRDIVEEFACECDKRGIVLGLYSNSAFVEKRLATHPDWYARPYGKPVIAGERMRQLINQCHHSPYYDIWLDATHEIVSRYRPAFYYIDCFQLTPGCSCRFCRERLRRDRRYGVPRTPTSARSQDYFRWVEQANRACARRAFDVVRQTDEATRVIWNGFWGRSAYFPEEARFFSTAIGDAYHTEAAVRFYGESFLHIDEQMLIADAVGTPAFTWVEYPRMPWSHLAAPPVEAEIKAAKVFANGARPMMWSLPAAPLPDLRGLAGVKKVFRLAAKHPELFDNTTLVADTSVLFSTSTSRWYPRSGKPVAVAANFLPPMDYRSEFAGQIEALLRAHVPTRVVLEDTDLHDTRVLLLPNAACMSRKHCERVRRFVRAGGGLVTTYETSLYDENGKKRKDFGLADVFGASFAADGGQVSFRNPSLSGGWIAGYMQLAGESALFEDLPRGFRFPVGGRTLHVRPRRNAEVPAQLLRPTRYYCDFPGEATQWPGAVIHKFGRGLCVYLPWQAGRVCEDHGLRDVDRLIAAAARFVRRKPLLLETNLPGMVTVTCRRALSGDVLIHLVNLSCDSKRDVISVSPARGASITLRLPDSIGGGRALVAAKPVKTGPAGDALKIVLPELGPYEVIHLRKKRPRR